MTIGTRYTHCSIKAEYGLVLFLPLLVFRHAKVSHMQHHSLGDPTNKQEAWAFVAALNMRMLNTGLSKESMPPTVRRLDEKSLAQARS